MWTDSKTLPFAGLDRGSVAICGDNQSRMGVCGSIPFQWSYGMESFQICGGLSRGTSDNSDLTRPCT